VNRLAQPTRAAHVDGSGYRTTKRPGRDNPAGGKRWYGGFTLLELAVVLAMIVLLAGLLLPVLGQAREKSRQTVCLSNVRQIAQAHLLYLQDWDERFPYWYVPAPLRPPPFGPRSYWTEYLQPYMTCTPERSSTIPALGGVGRPTGNWPITSC
jgi:type II secretory pathway pseudopilin PulG